MKLRVFQRGFNYSQDGPGNRLVWHLQGCHLRCPWCANPEGLSADGGTEYTLAELVDEAVGAKALFFDGGGVTLTGGEPALQHHSASALLEALGGHGIHRALESAAAHPGFARLLPLADYCMVDVKHYNAERLRKVIGADDDVLRKNLGLLRQADKPFLLRIPLIGGFNAGQDDALGFARYLDELGFHGAGIELLCYHEYGKVKWERQGWTYRMENAFISEETRHVFAHILENNGYSIIRT